MRKFFILTFFIFTTLCSFGQVSRWHETIKSHIIGDYDWTPLIEAIAQVESNGNPRAVGGNSCGILQITPICLKQANQDIGKNKYTLKDRFDVGKSVEIFCIIQNKHNPTKDIEKAIRMWNGGPRCPKKATQRYYEKVMKYYKPNGE